MYNLRAIRTMNYRTTIQNALRIIKIAKQKHNHNHNHNYNQVNIIKNKKIGDKTKNGDRNLSSRNKR